MGELLDARCLPVTRIAQGSLTLTKGNKQENDQQIVSLNRDVEAERNKKVLESLSDLERTLKSQADTATKFNYLNHQQWNDLAKERADCKGNSDCVRQVDQAYARLSQAQDMKLATCDARGDCAELINEVRSGNAAQQELIASGQLDGFAATPNLQNVGNRLANDPAYRAQVNQAVVAAYVCETNPAQCDRQAKNAAMLLGGLVVGAGGAPLIAKGVSWAAEAAGVAVEACLLNVVLCANRAGIAVSDILAGEALGPGSIAAGAGAAGAAGRAAGNAGEGGQAIRGVDEIAAAAAARAAESGLSRASSISSGLGEVKGTYTGIVNVREAGPLPNNLAGTFAGGRYDVVQLSEDAILYRAGTADQPLGQFFSTIEPQGVLQTRIDQAISPVWPNGATSPLDTAFTVKIPAGTEVYVGRTGTQGRLYSGGANQILVIKPWMIDGVEVIGRKPIK